MPGRPNEDQIGYWNDAPGQTWAELAPLLDRQIEGIGGRAMDALAPGEGERILDVGCGCGQTSVALARRVGAQGQVTGLDISAPMLAVARRRGEGLSQLSFVEGDAQVFAFPPAAADAAFSRFGVMFFADPSAAFGNIRRGLRPGGRLAFCCWRDPALNPFMTLPFLAALPLLPEPPAPPDPTAPGPFAFADEGRLRGILEKAGFASVQIEPFTDRIGGGTLDEAMTLAFRIGPLGRLIREQPELEAKVRDAVRAAIAPQVEDGRVAMGSASWRVTARNP